MDDHPIADGLHDDGSTRQNLFLALGIWSRSSHSFLTIDGSLEEHGACDKGIMYGYATDETAELMPRTLTLAHKLNRALTVARKTGALPCFRPDTKAQVTFEHKKDGGVLVHKKDGGVLVPVRVDTVVVSTQRAGDITTEHMRSGIPREDHQESHPS